MTAKLRMSQRWPQAFAIAAWILILPSEQAFAQLPPAGLSTSGSTPPIAREFRLDELTPEVLDQIFPADRGYRPRASHPVQMQDLNACPESGGSPIQDLIALSGTPVSLSRGGTVNVNIQADLNSVRMPFENNSNQLDAASQRGLTNLVSYLLNPRLQARRVLVEGHANATGSREINYRLTCERAASVRGLLRAKGIGGERLLVMGRGFDAPDPKFPDAKDGRQRRVTLRFLPP